jgi:hypothetical protein
MLCRYRRCLQSLQIGHTIASLTLDFAQRPSSTAVCKIKKTMAETSGVINLREASHWSASAPYVHLSFILIEGVLCSYWFFF